MKIDRLELIGVATMQSIRPERQDREHKSKGMLRLGKAAIITAALASSMGHIPARKADTVPTEGYLVTDVIPTASKLTGVINIREIRAESLIRCDTCKGGYLDVTKSLGPFSIQLNMHLRAVKRDGKSQDFWLQDLIITKESKSGKLEYSHYSEIFKLRSPTDLGIINPRTVNGNGKIYNQYIYNPETKKSFYNGNTYVYNTHYEPFRFPFFMAMSVETHTVNGFLEVSFEYSKRDRKTIKFDTVRIGKRGEYRSGYIYADSRDTDASFGIAGDGNGSVAYIPDLKGCMGMAADIYGYFVPLRYTNGVVQSGERAINMVFISPPKNGMVRVGAAYK